MVLTVVYSHNSV